MSSRSHENFRVQVLLVADAVLVGLAFWLAWDLRDIVRTFLGMGVEEHSVRDNLYWALFLVVPITPLVLERFGFYQRLRSKRGYQAAGQIFKAMLVMALLIGMVVLFAKFTEARRLALGIGMVGTALGLYLRDRLVCKWLKRSAANEKNKERVILAGNATETKALYEELDAEVTDAWSVACHFDLENRAVEELYTLLKDHSVERVIFVTRDTSFQKVAAAVEACELQGVEAWIAAAFIRNQIARPTFDALGDKPMLVLRSTPELSWELMAKEVIDRIGAACLILATLPLWIIAWFGIRIASPGAPAFFCQQRAGRYGKPFRMWKFRTMIPDAEKMLHKIKEEHGNEMDGPVFKLGKDPRVFAFGSLLRKLSIDELPQLINVLRGEMSLVGPRPLPTYEVEAFGKLAHRRRLSVKPGITCEWQIRGRNQITSFEDWVELDLRYIDTWSLWHDFSILLRTIPAVLFGKGAK